MQNQKSGEQTGRIFQRLHRFKSQLHRGAVPDALSDNHYILAVMCDRVLICEKDRTLRRELADTALQRRVLGAVSDLDPAMDEAQIIKALSLHDPDDCFLRVLLPVWGAELLRGIADAARRKGVPDDFDIRIAWLHRLRTMDFDALRDALSPVEALLRKDPLGTYPRCSDETKAAYREAVRRRAEACGEDEETVLNEILDSLKEQNTSMDLSDVLFEKNRNRGLLFHAVVLAAAFLCSALTGVFLRRFGFLRAVIPAIFVFLPFYALFREAGSILIGRVMRPMETLSLRLDTVPGEGCTLTVITTLLSGEERDRAIFDNLERFWLRNCPRGETGSEHLYFGVLGDLPEAQHAEAPGDGAILRYAAARIDALNRKYGDHFGLWIRSRRYAPTEHCFMGWERKRGAVLELARRLRGVETGFAVAKEPAGIGRTVYLCTLDGDTELPPGALVTMVSAMLHPANKPVIENGRVVRGIGMLQPRMAVSLAGAAATRFTLLCTGKGGADPYSRFSADGEQMLYGEGSFCGKGLFNVDAYLAVLDGAFPEGCVLSHDFLEGQRLGCRNFSSVTLTDRIPTGVVSYFERQARWVRGDTQALRFAFSTVKNAAGEKIPNPVPLTGRLRVWDHFLYALIPAAVVRCVLYAAFAGYPVGTALCLCLLAFSSRLLRPVLLLGKGYAWGSLFRKFTGLVLTDLRQSILWLGFRIRFAAYEAWVNLRAVVTALWRMGVSKEHLLAWITAGEAEQKRQKNGHRGLFISLQASCIQGVLLLFSPHWFLKFLGVLWLTSPIRAEKLGRAYAVRNRKRPALSREDCTRYAAEIWRFFADEAGADTRYLPPDNVQWFPYPEKKAAKRTSPTNIGLYFLACFAARDFDLIGNEELIARLTGALDTVMQLDRCRGHLYNWYDLETGQRIGAPYLSAVDSGNFACAMITAAGAAEERMGEDIRFCTLAHNMRSLAIQTDFSVFYDEKKHLLSLGYDTEREQRTAGYYDLYFSEARSAVYFAVAAGQIPPAAWWTLGRPAAVRERRLGALSWSGSAFEYFMPALWLGVPENSYSFEVLSFAVDMQTKDRMTVISGDGGPSLFGKSEGGYFAFDAERNFQYQPCGSALLGMKNDLSAERLVMPYASFLMLPFVKGNEVRENLAALSSLGMRGIYGFYEALDLTPARVGGGYAVVRSVMAHHLGMSLTALANTAFDGIFQKRFARDPRMEAAGYLLEEIVPADADPAELVPVLDRDTERTPARCLMERGNEIPVRAGTTLCTVISNTSAGLIADAGGAMYLYDRGLALTVPEPRLSAIPPLFFLEAGGRVYSPCRMTGEGHAAYSFLCQSDLIRYSAVYDDGVTAILEITLCPDRTEFRFILSLTRDGMPFPHRMMVLFRPVLMAPGAYTVHPTFADLFLSSEWEHDAGRVTFRRRARGRGEPTCALHTLCQGITDAGAETDMGAVLPMGYGVRDILSVPGRYAEILEKPITSSAVVPCVFLSGNSGGSSTVRMILTSGGEIPQTVAAPALRLSDLRAEHRSLCGGILPDDKLLSEMLCAVLYKRTRIIRDDGACSGEEPGRVDRPAGREKLWKYGISGDLPLLVCPVEEKEDGETPVRMTIFAWKYLLISGIRCDLVLLTAEDDDDYRKPAQNMALRCIRACGVSALLKSAHGGVFLIPGADARRDGIPLRAAWIRGGEQETAEQPHEHRLEPLPWEREVFYSADEEKIVIRKGKQRVPWTHILTNGNFGTLVTQDTLGFTFFGNARECRVTPWYPEPLSLRCGEEILLRTAPDAPWIPLCRGAQHVIITPECVRYQCAVGGLDITLAVSVPDRRRRKQLALTVKNTADSAKHLTVSFRIEPLFGAAREDGECIAWDVIPAGVRFCSLTNEVCSRYYGELSLELPVCHGIRRGDFLCTEGDFTVPAGGDITVTAALAVYRFGERCRDGACTLQPLRVPKRKFLDTGIPYLDLAANRWLPVQIFHSRLWGRCGFWQPGGAYGFRDQLQDAMAAAYLHPDTLKAQLYRGAAHQYEAGDVQHWWHPLPPSDPEHFHKGIRSRCSDDYLWLPLACAHYIRLTGDRSVLDREIAYLESEPLRSGEQERYEEPRRTRCRESLYMHCVRALEHGFRFGAHGLPLMGCGDWNDGMNAVGTDGRGESVFCGMFLLLTLDRFLPLAEARGDAEGVRRYRSMMKHLADAVEEHAWNGVWYRRAWYDDGCVMGDPGQPEAEIDLLPQAFAAIIHAAVRLPDGGKPFSEDRVHGAMLCAYEKLFDEEHGVFSLLSPPFSGREDRPYPGYIAGYMPGLRENGGQYTHAAVWGAMGLFAVGEEEKGMRVLRAINPFYQTQTEAGLIRYQKEPYALCGDVLTAEDRIGEGGWSQYTGSAGWYFRLLIEVFGRDHLPDIASQPGE